MPKCLKSRLLKRSVLPTLALFSCIFMGAAFADDQPNLASKEWPSFGGDFSNQRLSPLTQINQHNVKNLQLAWQFKSGVVASFQATPIVTNGVMYLAHCCSIGTQWRRLIF